MGQSRQHFHADGSLAGYVGTITDVTNLKKAEEERKRLEAQTRHRQLIGQQPAQALKSAVKSMVTGYMNPPEKPAGKVFKGEDVAVMVDAAFRHASAAFTRRLSSTVGSRRISVSSGSRTRRMRVPVARISFCSAE